MSESRGEDLIESASRPKSAWWQRLGPMLPHPAAAAAILVVGLLAGLVGGFVVGQGNPITLTSLGYAFVGPYPPGERPLELKPFEQSYGRPPLPTLSQEDVAALGEDVTREYGVISARSAIPVMCGASLGQPGTPTYLDLRYPSTVFGVDGGEISELVWPQPDAPSASATLRSLVFQAQQCPEVPNFQTSVVTGGVQSGIGDEYATFSQQPTVAGDPGALFASVVLVRLGADFIEIAFSSDGLAVPDADARCLRVAEAAVDRASGG